MRLTIEHHRTKAEVVENIDRSFNDAFQGLEGLPVKIVVKQKTWNGSILTFVLAAKIGLLSNPIKGTIEVTDTDLTIDADLGMLNRLVPEEKAREMLGHKIKGLLN
jgi:hypothetical protein